MSNLSLEVLNLSKKYEAFQALDNLSFCVEKGECVGLLGSNGAGKSTTIRIITGQLKPSAGTVRVLGIDPVVEPKKVHNIIGYIPDSPTVYDEITVEQNIEAFRQIYGVSKNRTQEILERLELTDKTKEKVKNLSKGLKQRVLIGRSLIHSPKVILLDEPTTGLDPSSAESIYQILEELKQSGATILLTTHLMNDVERLCDKIIFLNKGEKIEEGAPVELKRKYRDKKIQIKRFINEEVEIEEVDASEGFAASIKSIKLDESIYSINTHEPKLEEIFIKLVRGQQ